MEIRIVVSSLSKESKEINILRNYFSIDFLSNFINLLEKKFESYFPNGYFENAFKNSILYEIENNLLRIELEIDDWYYADNNKSVFSKFVNNLIYYVNYYNYKTSNKSLKEINIYYSNFSDYRKDYIIKEGFKIILNLNITLEKLIKIFKLDNLLDNTKFSYKMMLVNKNNEKTFYLNYSNYIKGKEIKVTLYRSNYNMDISYFTEKESECEKSLTIRIFKLGKRDIITDKYTIFLHKLTNFIELYYDKNLKAKVEIEKDDINYDELIDIIKDIIINNLRIKKNYSPLKIIKSYFSKYFEIIESSRFLL